MDSYLIWFDLRDRHKDLEFCEALEKYMAHLKQKSLIEDWRLMRRKLGLGPSDLGDFQIEIRVRNLAQLEEAFQGAAARTGEFEKLHAEVYSRVENLKFALYRDFPDAVRKNESAGKIGFA